MVAAVGKLMRHASVRLPADQCRTGWLNLLVKIRILTMTSEQKAESGTLRNHSAMTKAQHGHKLLRMPTVSNTTTLFQP
ncbi:hypothetical protein [Solidesulfovibrio magneticus]|uniref:hypothetical protein n=1 Tax=Solidesulfovibrio magneticus TaxID=184917 RepID=UPI0011D1386D|nr:hypothetical protein [Solidesulfovibrio magneticus]